MMKIESQIIEVVPTRMIHILTSEKVDALHSETQEVIKYRLTLFNFYDSS